MYTDYLFEEEIKQTGRTKIFNRLLQKVKSLSKNRFKDIINSSWIDFVDLIKEKNVERKVLRIFNKHFGTHYTSLDSISEIELKDSSIEAEVVTEGFSQWWNSVKSEGFPVLAFYPALNCWLEIDKIFKGTDIDMLKLTVYGTLWVLLVSGKYLLAKNKKEEKKVEEVFVYKRKFNEDNPDSWSHKRKRIYN